MRGMWRMPGKTEEEQNKITMYHFTFWSLKNDCNTFFWCVFFPFEQRVSHLIILCPFAIVACRKWDFVIAPPWPGNYPNLPSSRAPASATHWLRPPLRLHYQCWDSLMAWRPHCAGCWGRETRGKGEKGEEPEEETMDEGKRKMRHWRARGCPEG